MRSPGRSTVDATPAGWSRRLELGALIFAAGLSVIVAGACFALSGRVRAAERVAVASRSESAREKDLSRRLGTLSGRVNASEESSRAQRASAAKLESTLSRLTSEFDYLKRSQEAAPSAAEVKELLTTVRALSGEVAQVKRLAEAAAQEPRAAPAPDGASAKDVAALAGRLSALDARVAELARKVSSLKKPQTRVDEEALRTAVNKIVQEEIKKAFEERRNEWRRRRQQQQ